MLIIKREKTEAMKGIELQNQEWVKTLEENEHYETLEILEADTSKEAQKRKEKCTLNERKRF